MKISMRDVVEGMYIKVDVPGEHPSIGTVYAIDLYNDIGSQAFYLTMNEDNGDTVYIWMGLDEEVEIINEKRYILVDAPFTELRYYTRDGVVYCTDIDDGDTIVSSWSYVEFLEDIEAGLFEEEHNVD